jgi:hypothetical protein
LTMPRSPPVAPSPTHPSTLTHTPRRRCSERWTTEQTRCCLLRSLQRTKWVGGTSCRPHGWRATTRCVRSHSVRGGEGEGGGTGEAAAGATATQVGEGRKFGPCTHPYASAVTRTHTQQTHTTPPAVCARRAARRRDLGLRGEADWADWARHRPLAGVADGVRACICVCVCRRSGQSSHQRTLAVVAARRGQIFIAQRLTSAAICCR